MKALPYILLILYLTPLLALFIGICGLLLVQTNLIAQIKKTLIISEDQSTLSLDEWLNDIHHQRYISFYIFHLTNNNQLISRKIYNRKYVEKGPYTYKLNYIRKNAKFNDDHSIITYYPSIQFIFDSDRSIGKQTDNITVPNLPLIFAWDSLRRLTGNFISLYLGKIMYRTRLQNSGDDLFINTTIDKLLFNGLDASFMKELPSLDFKLPSGKFAILLQKNNTLLDSWSVGTGKIDFNQYLQVIQVNGNSSLNCWKGSKCNEFNGTNGEYFPFPITSEDILYYYEPSLNRTIKLNYLKDINYNGIDIKRFVLPNKTFQISANDCYCIYDGYCSDDGVLDLSNCRSNSPIFASAPHFYGGKDNLLENNDGLYPKSIHQTYFDIDQVSGVVVKSHRKYQYNIHVVKWNEESKFHHLFPMMIPVFWTDEFTEIKPEYFSHLKTFRESPKIHKIIYNIFLAIGIIGVMVPIVVFIIIIINMKRNKEEINMKKLTQKRLELGLQLTPQAQADLNRALKQQI